MSINKPYRGPGDLPNVIPVFPLVGRLAAAARGIAAEYFRAALSRDDRRCARDASHDRHDSAGRRSGGRRSNAGAAIHRLRRPHDAIRRNRRRALSHHADGHRALPHFRGNRRRTPYRQCRVDFSDFRGDFTPSAGEEAVDRESVLRTLREFAEVNELPVDWDSVREAPNEALVNALSMMSPYGRARSRRCLKRRA